MDCTTYREEFSATLDGEDAMLAAGVLDAHLGRCAACAEWADTAAALHRAARVGAAPNVPDLVAPILAAAHAARNDKSAVDDGALARVARLALAAVGIAELISAAQGLFGGSTAGSTLHAVHELGSFDVALAVGFIAAAIRPAFARGMLPLVAALVATLAAVTIADVVSSHAGWGPESVHLLAFFGLPMLWIAGQSTHDDRLAPRPRLSPSPDLRAA